MSSGEEELGSRVREVDFEAEGLDLALKSLRFNFGIVTGLEELCSGVVVEGAVGEQMPRNIQNRVGDGDGGSVGTPSFR